mgnify:CR=1 FL=1
MAKNNPDTEKESLYANLEKMSTEEIHMKLNTEDKKIYRVIKKQSQYRRKKQGNQC